MIEIETIRKMVGELRASGKFVDDNSIAHHITARMHDLSSRCLVGSEVIRKKENNEISLKPFGLLSDEEFTTLVFDFYISDRQMAKIFDVSDSTISRRRNKLKIVRNTKDGAFQLCQWVMSDRIAPDVNDFLKSIAA